MVELIFEVFVLLQILSSFTVFLFPYQLGGCTVMMRKWLKILEAEQFLVITSIGCDYGNRLKIKAIVNFKHHPYPPTRQRQINLTKQLLYSFSEFGN